MEPNEFLSNFGLVLTVLAIYALAEMTGQDHCGSTLDIIIKGAHSVPIFCQ
jgi:hypothetical protein